MRSAAEWRPRPRLLEPLRARNFRLLWLGHSVSLLGDQFYNVALPWLTLQVTGSSRSVGMVMVGATVPRLIFLLVGGALSDRLEPRRILSAVNLYRGGLLVLLSALVFWDAIRFWQISLIAIVLALANSFYHPALMRLIPLVVEQDQLKPGNTLLQATTQLNWLLGPATAGFIISFANLTLAFGLDAVTFFVALWTVWLMKKDGHRPSSEDIGVSGGRHGRAGGELLFAIREGLRYAWGSPAIRDLLLLIALVEFAFAGPFTVGLASLTKNRFAEGATTLGMLLSAFGGGALLGTFLAGSLRDAGRAKWRLLGVYASLGMELALLGFAPDTRVAGVLVGLVGMGGGYINVTIMTWLQIKAEAQMLGRVMSLVSLSVIILSPVSYALTGWLVDAHSTMTFVAAGAVVLAATAYAKVSRGLTFSEGG